MRKKNMLSVVEILRLLLLLAAALIIGLGALKDASSFKIPNLVSLGLIVLFPFYGLTIPDGQVAWLGHLGVFAIILGGGYALYTRHWLGAGDAKFAAAIGLWAGPSFWAPFLAVTAISGGVLSLGLCAWAYWKGRVARSREGRGAWLRVPVPYGVAIALGGLCTLLLISHPEFSFR